jgi:hypothetical protein
MALVIGVTICFSIQLPYIEGVSVGEDFKGYIPSSAIVQAQGYDLHQSRLLNHSRVRAHAMLLVSTKAVVFSVQRSCLIASILEVEKYMPVFANSTSQGTSQHHHPTPHLHPSTFIKYRLSLFDIRHPQLHGLLHHRASNRPLHVRSLHQRRHAHHYRRLPLEQQLVSKCRSLWHP